MIPKYPLELSDAEGIADALNYLLSGPAGLGQNFDGFSDYNPAIIRPTFARPFTLPVDTTLDPSWYLRLPITNITATPNPGQYIVVDFTAAYTTPPFQFGDRLLVQDVNSPANPGFYNDRYFVFSCTTTSVTLYTQAIYTWPAYVSGGKLVRDSYNVGRATDCIAEVQVDSLTQRIFITAQLEITYTGKTETSPPLPTYYGTNFFDIVFQINRYVISRNENGNQVYSFQKTISQDIVSAVGATNPFTNQAQVIFTTVIDQQLNFGSYAYILEVAFVTQPTLSDGNNAGTSGYDSTPGSLISYDFATAELPSGVTVGNLQNQSTPYATRYNSVVTSVISSNNPAVFATPPVVDVILYPDIVNPLYVAGVQGDIPNATVEILCDRTLTNVQIVGVAGQFTCDDHGLRVNDTVRIVGTNVGTGTITGYVNPTTYKVSVTNNATTFTLQTLASAPIVTTAGTTLGLTFEYGVTGSNTNTGYQPGDVLKILGTNIGGATPLNDLYLTVTTTDLDSNQVPGVFTMGLRNLTTQVIKE